MSTLLEAAPRPRPTRIIPLASDHLEGLQQARAQIQCALELSSLSGDVRDLLELADVRLKKEIFQASCILSHLTAGVVR